MTDTEMLKSKISSSGLKITFIAMKLGISREALYKKIRNEQEFKASEISCLKECLALTNTERDNIFFAKRVE